uniref:Uncharacterized protein n=1 Tax=Anguilla anguilla TaxID=7936 RepID=A0A0E9VYM8_ANGAN
MVSAFCSSDFTKEALFFYHGP